MEQSNSSITKVFILSITFLFCWCLAQFWNISYFLINFSSVDAWPTRRAPLGQPPAKISHVFQQISTATGRLIAGSVIFYHIITFESIIHNLSGRLIAGSGIFYHLITFVWIQPMTKTHELMFGGTGGVVTFWPAVLIVWISCPSPAWDRLSLCSGTTPMKDHSVTRKALVPNWTVIINAGYIFKRVWIKCLEMEK